MIFARFGTIPVAAISATMLPQPGLITADQAAIALSAFTAGTDKEHRLALAELANPLPKNHIAMRRHTPSLAGLDNGNGFVALLKSSFG